MALALQGAHNATVKTWFIAVVLKLMESLKDDAFVKVFGPWSFVIGHLFYCPTKVTHTGYQDSKSLNYPLHFRSHI